MRKSIFFVVIALLVAMLSACGGGGGAGGDASSNDLLVTEVSPKDGETGVDKTSAIVIKTNKEVNMTSMTTNTFRITAFTNASTAIGGTYTKISSLEYRFKPTADLTAGAGYNVKVADLVAIDGSVQKVPKKTTFTVATGIAPPSGSLTVSSTNPSNGAIGVDPTKPIQLTLKASDAVPVVLTTATVSFSVDGTAIAGVPTVSGANVNFVQSSALPAGKKIDGLLSAAQDTAGRTLAAAYPFSFTTASVPVTDTTPPSVLSTAPLDNAVNVPINSVLAFQWDEPIQGGVGTVTWATASGVPVQFDTAYSVSSLLVTPKANMLNKTTYIATVSGQKDLAGNAMVGTKTINFKTEAPSVTLTTATSIGIIKDLATRGTWDGATGVAKVLIAGNPWDFAVAWKNVSVTAGATYQVSFPCSAVPANSSIQVELKNHTTYVSYGKAYPTCNSGTITADVLCNTTDPAARLSINLGKAPATFTLGNVKLTEQ